MNVFQIKCTTMKKKYKWEIFSRCFAKPYVLHLIRMLTFWLQTGQTLLSCASIFWLQSLQNDCWPQSKIYFSIATWLQYKQRSCQKYGQTSFMNLDDIFLKKHNVNMAYYKIDKIHLNTRGSKALANEIKNKYLNLIFMFMGINKWSLKIYDSTWFIYIIILLLDCHAI